MESFINLALYFIALIGVFVPVFGFGLAPGGIINVALTAFAANTAAQIKDEKLIDEYVEKNKNNPIGKMISSIFSAM